MENNNENIYLIAEVTILQEVQKEFKQLGSRVFPLLAKKMGWSLLSLWSLPKPDSTEIILHNIWKSDLNTEEEVNKKFEDTVGELSNNKQFQSDLDELDRIIGDNEKIYYTKNFDF